MKRSFTVLTALALFMVLCIGAQAAESSASRDFRELDFIEKEGFCTVITDIYGEDQFFDGVLDIRTMESCDCVAQIAEYAILNGEDVVLSAQLHEILPTDTQTPSASGAGGKTATNGFYSVEFPIGNGSHDVFLTGLTPDNLLAVQDAAIDAILTQSELTLEDIAFIDTEKQYDIFDEDGWWKDSDKQLCWAASTSNILYYTGWAQKAGFASTDYMYEELIDRFNDNGGRCYFGLQWFFNGYNRRQGYGGWASDESNYSSFKGYLPDYCVDTVAREIYFDERDSQMNDALLGLKNGCGVELNLGWYPYGEPERNGGHSITLWGMVTDREKYASNPADKSAYCALIVSDSDSHVTLGENRRTAPNTLQLRRLEPICLAGYDSWDIVEYSYWQAALVEGVVLLQPYSDSVPKDGGTRNATSSYDLTAFSSRTYSADSGNSTAYFASGERIAVCVEVENIGRASYSQAIPYTVRVYNADTDAEVYDSGSLNKSYAGSLGFNNYVTDEYMLTKTLPTGRYRVEITLGNIAGEAYYGNNKTTLYFYVGSRKQSNDTLRLKSASARYSAEDYRGYRGTLYLSYSGDIGYAVREYLVQVKYSDEPSYTTIYRGDWLPEEVSGLETHGDSLTLGIFAIPEDPLVGYERVVCEEVNVPLSYLYLYPTVEDYKVFKPITEGETKLKNGDSIDVTIHKEATRTDDDYLVIVTAENYTASYSLIEASQNFNDFDIYGEKYLSFSQFTTDELPAGEYEIYVYTNYDANEYGYSTNYFRTYVGDLTVLAEGAQPPAEDDDYEIYAYLNDNSDPFSTEFECDLTAPAGAEFTIHIDYGTAPDSMTQFIEKRITDYPGGYDWMILSVPTQPGQTYYYQVSLLADGKEPICAFNEPDTFSSCALPEQIGTDEQIYLDFQRDDFEYAWSVSVYYRFAARAGGEYLISLDNTDLLLEVWDDQAGEWKPAAAKPFGYEHTVSVSADRDVFLRVTAHDAGSGWLLVSAKGELLRMNAAVNAVAGAMMIPLDYGEVAYFDTLCALSDTTVTLTASGADGLLEYWDEDMSIWREGKYFTTDGKSMEFSISAGERVYFRIKAFVKGDYTLTCTASGDVYDITEAGAKASLRIGQSGQCILAAYDADGRMVGVDVAAVNAGDTVWLQIAGKNIDTLRCFRLTNACKPSDMWERQKIS